MVRSLIVAAPRVDVLGVHVCVTSMEDTLRDLSAWIEAGERTWICVCDVNSLLSAREEPGLRAFYNQSGATLPDGVPLVWANRYAGHKNAQRVSGPDLFPATLRASEMHGWRHYLLGGSPGVAERLVEDIRRQWPNCQIVGWSCPPFRKLTQEERASLIEEINSSGAQIVWVAFGAPKQEKWMAENRAALAANVLIGVGAAFNFQVGDIKRAPKWIQRYGLEWLFRLFQEPTRLWRRYLIGVPSFLFRISMRPPRPVRDGVARSTTLPDAAHASNCG